MREIAVFAPLIVLAFWIGIYPKPFFELLERPVAQIVERVRPGYYAERKLRNPLAAAPLVHAAPPVAAAR
jgi:NADH-quinone oxidoreductase subunit M